MEAWITIYSALSNVDSLSSLAPAEGRASPAVDAVSVGGAAVGARRVLALVADARGVGGASREYVAPADARVGNRAGDDLDGLGALAPAEGRAGSPEDAVGIGRASVGADVVLALVAEARDAVGAGRLAGAVADGRGGAVNNSDRLGALAPAEGRT